MSKENGFEVSGSTTWLGRKRGAEKTTNSFKAFLEKAKHNSGGQDHLKRHHGGFGL